MSEEEKKDKKDKKEKEKKDKDKKEKEKEKEKEKDKSKKDKDKDKKDKDKDKGEEKEEEEKKMKEKAEENKESKDIQGSNGIDIPPFPNKSSLEILSSINSDMDMLSNRLKNNLISFSSYPSYKQDFNSNPSLTNNYNHFYDKEDLEIKQLLNKANQFLGTNNNNNFNNFNSNNNMFNYDFNKKYENKTCQSDNGNIKYLYNNYNYSNTNGEMYNNMENINKYNNQGNKINMNYDFENNNQIQENGDNYYQKSGLNNLNNYLEKKDFINNDNNDIPKSYPHFKNKKEYEGNDFDKSIMNRTKRIEDLYKYTNNPLKKPMIYTQPDSPPLNNNINFRQRNNFGDSNYNNNGNYSISKDNDYIEKNKYLRFDSDGVNKAIDILNGKI